MSLPGDFDKHAATYEQVHAQNVRPSGEDPSYFARYKLWILERLLGRGFAQPVLDFGCGVGTLTALLISSFPRVDGYDPSAESLKLARLRASSARFLDRMDAIPDSHYGAVILANVLHHVPAGQRAGLLRKLAAALSPNGSLIVFEHNRLNPVTRRVVSACPFDDGAQLLFPGEVKRLLRGAGLAAVRLDHIVFFPRPLRLVRALEPWLRWLPLGAQVCAWGRKQ
jgi:SAM-dependent methyltransferase